MSEVIKGRLVSDLRKATVTQRLTDYKQCFRKAFLKPRSNEKYTVVEKSFWTPHKFVINCFIILNKVFKLDAQALFHPDQNWVFRQENPKSTKAQEVQAFSCLILSYEQ